MPSSGCRQRGRASCVHRAETTLKALGCALVGTGRPRSGRPPRGQATTTLRGGDRYPQPSPSPLPPPPLASRADLSEGHAHRYWVTDGLGLFELLTLCELLHSTCQMSIYTGYSMGRRYVPVAQSETFAQDAVDMLDFANAAPASSPWAAVRERMGHAAPFGLSRVEVGNEERDMSGEGYPAHYELITRRLWAAYPSLHIVASGRWGPPIEGSPCLTGQRCDLWDDHYYRPPDVMAAMGGEYDRYNRSLPKVYVGEFAANGGAKRSLRAALAEAIFMIGFERNADVVVASSFAPLCNNVRGTQWAYNLVNLNSSRLFVLPSYHVQTLLSSALGAHTLPATLTPPYAQGVKAFSRRRGLSSSKPPQPRLTTAPPASRWIATASMDARARLVNLKLVNYAPNARPVDVAWSGERAFARVLNATVLTAASAEAQNNLSMPDAVAPAALDPPPALGPTGLSIAMPPWSLVVVTVALGDQ
uniref:non-reducing end alpha-L-arabinofuranosidase n=2 Tax=Emiliania huxleyi TaxID=2903 RepID=A0A6V2SII0_EMIHU|mmetsp:Transcript_13481/g.39488  ORF Transcript_13481/g.39488 Transcript_13481/m.39488 type:complete len:475 (+) Transcript_13481:968-2392(+)